MKLTSDHIRIAASALYGVKLVLKVENLDLPDAAAVENSVSGLLDKGSHLKSLEITAERVQ